MSSLATPAPFHLNYRGRLKYKQALSAWFNQLPADCFMTLNFNVGSPSLDWARGKLEFFWKVLNRRLLGPRWRGKAAKIQIRAVPEHLYSNLHYHCLVALPNPSDIGRFKRVAAAEFAGRIVKSGQVHFHAMGDAPSKQRMSDYMTKEAHNPEVIQNFVIL